MGGDGGSEPEVHDAAADPGNEAGCVAEVDKPVEDDGRGFDHKTTDVKKGAGLRNIKNRINYFNGVLDIASDPGNGTSVSIELIA